MGLDFLRRADWLEATRARGYLRLVALLNMAALVFLIASSRGGIDRNGFLIGTDFLSFWTTGHMLHAHQNVYDAAEHTAAQRLFFAQKDGYTAYFYPPVFLPFCWPLGFLGYFPALMLWLMATGAACFAAARLWLSRMQLVQPLLVLFAAFPPVLITVTHGQTAFLVAALLGGGAFLVRDRPWLAGALFGLAVVKPQFGLLVPVVLVLTGEWRTITSAVLTATLLAAGVTLVFGPQVWGDWFQLTSAAQAAMDNGAVGFAKMQSPFAAARLLAVPVSLAYALQGIIALAVVASIAFMSWGRRYDLDVAALMLAGTPLVTPFVLDYDMVLLGFPLIWLGGQRFRPWEKLVFVATFIAPIFARPLAMTVGIPIMPFTLIAFFIIVLRRAANIEHPLADRAAAGAESMLS
jgi:hypothetical protein